LKRIAERERSIKARFSLSRLRRFSERPVPSCDELSVSPEGREAVRIEVNLVFAIVLPELLSDNYT